MLREVFGFTSFRGSQEAIVDRVVAGHDTVVLMPTGGGKSLCYQLPALVRPGVGIVVSPLIALMHDQVEALRLLGVRAAFWNSTSSFEESSAVRRDLLAGELDLLYVAPERLLMPSFLAFLNDAASGPGHRAVRDRRGALRVAVGPRLPPGVPPDRRRHLALPARAAHRAHRHRRRAHPSRDPPAAAARRRDRVRLELRPAQHPLRRRGEERRAGAAAALPRDRQRRRGLPRLGRHRLLPVAQAHRRDRRAAAQQGLRRHRLPRRALQRRARGGSAAVPPRRRRDRGGDHRVRHGHRQARRPLRRARRPAQEPRGLLPGDRPRGPRRRAGRGVDGLRPRRRRAAALVHHGLRRIARAPAGRLDEARRDARATPRRPRADAACCWRTSTRSRATAATATPA